MPECVDEGCAGLAASFDDRIAARDVADYRRHGLVADQRLLLRALVSDGLEGRTILDIGGGIGAIHHHLLRAGARGITDIDASAAYLRAAEAEAYLEGDVDRIQYRHGDFVDLADTIDPADVVILLRVLCCYREMASLVRASASHATRTFGLIYPRSTWWMRLAASAFDRLRPLTGTVSGPGWVHAESAVDATVRGQGFESVVVESTWYWRIALYRRVDDPGRSRSAGPM